MDPVKLWRLDSHKGGRHASRAGIFLGRLILVLCFVLLPFAHR